MISIDAARQLALSFDETEEMPHFEKTSFRIRKKIFLTIDEEKKLACVMLSPEDQDVFNSLQPMIVYPVPNKWGLKGATYVDLRKVGKAILKDMLTRAYCKIAPPALAGKYDRDTD